MSDRIPISRAALLDDLDDAEVIEGYYDGLENEPEPGDNRSFRYWHGWRNGMADGRHRENDEAQRALVKDALETGYLRNLGRNLGRTGA